MVGESWTSTDCDRCWKFLLAKLFGLAHGSGFGEQWLSTGWKPQRDTCSEGSVAGWTGSVLASTVLQTQTNTVFTWVGPGVHSNTGRSVGCRDKNLVLLCLMWKKDGPCQQDSVPTSVHPPTLLA